MGIGGALAEARSEAGLTITQVSERTRIRATIIRDIERDDYAACGGDFYARGHIRAIAKVVGTDPVPLVKEYDAAHLPPPELDNVGPPEQAEAGQPRRTAWFSSLTLSDPPGEEGQGVPGGITAAEAFRPAMPLRLPGGNWLRGSPGRAHRRHGSLAVIAVLVIVGLVTYLLVSGSSTPAKPAAHQSRTSAHHDATKNSAAKGSAPKKAASTSAPVVLTPASAAAFGPDGTAQGDNQQLAALAIDGSASTAWQTDWYSSTNFAGLQPGTGLLLNLGSPDTVTSATLALGPAAGGTVQLRAGNSRSLSGLPVVAQAANPGGSLTLRPASPVAAKYLLIWFTGLPADSSGTYQASIYNVRLSGHPAAG